MILAIISGIGLAWLLATAKIFKKWREFMTDKYGADHFINELINCPNCLSVWTTFVMFAGIMYFSNIFIPLGCCFTAYIISFIISKIK